jgi:microcystin-dependent protein
LADIPTVSWDETSPPDDQNRSLGDNRITEIKTQIREILAADHEFIYTGQGTEWGYHNKVTLITGTSDPTAVADCIILYAKDVNSKAELHFIDEDSNTMQLTSAGDWVGGMVDEIRMWSGTLANIPAGWALCNGTSGRPDLLAKFVCGINTAVTEPGTSDGSNSITLTYVNNPSHTHTVATDGSHGHSSILLYTTSGSGSFTYPRGYSSRTRASNSGYITTDGAHTHGGGTGVGSGSAIDNRPAYYEIAYIARS